MNKRERNTGPGAKDRINKDSTAEAERDREAEFDTAGNSRRRGEDPSPDDRERGERSNVARVESEDLER